MNVHDDSGWFMMMHDGAGAGNGDGDGDLGGDVEWFMTIIHWFMLATVIQ